MKAVPVYHPLYTGQEPVSIYEIVKKNLRNMIHDHAEVHKNTFTA